MNEIKIHRPQIQNANAQKSVRPANSDKYIPEEIKGAAQGLEAQFNELMVKEMTKSLNSGVQNTAGNFYNGLMTSERAKALVKEDSQIQKMILNEIYPKHMRNEQNYQNYLDNKNKYAQNQIRIEEGPTQPSQSIAMKQAKQIGVKYE
ncbi:hypothetical protein [Halobacteriovorax sp. ZH4_bin.1]|uniref:hypothetical protein n=1 Tax=unclassified Halobacteriovorax TaxID=2639665 RepID=UPI003720176D